MDVLVHRYEARFSELRPPRVDTNLFSYHLKLLVRDGLVTKLGNKTYTLSSDGLSYVDRASGEMSLRVQPKNTAMLLIQNSDGAVLLQKRGKQPYINTWSLPLSNLHIEDVSIKAAAKRLAREKLELQDLEVRHVGDCYIRVHAQEKILSTTSVHVFRSEVDTVSLDESTVWVDPRKLGNYDLAPAVEQIISRSFFGDDHFFAEFEHEWIAPTS